MGQYYIPTIISVDGEINTLYSHDFGSGSKLTEHSWVGNYLVNAIYSKIHKQPATIAWIGDYSDEGKKEYEKSDELYTQTIDYRDFKKYYKIAWGKSEKYFLPKSNFSDKDFDVFTDDTKGMFLVNHTIKRYLDLEKYIEQCSIKDKDGDAWCLNPLSLLTACGNGRGGGDFHHGHTGYKDVGAWAFHLLEYTDEIPGGYMEAEFSFIED